MMERLLAKIDANIGKVDTNLKEMKEEMTARLEGMIQNNQEKMEAVIVANNEKFEVFQTTLVSQTDIHQARTEAIQEEIIAKMDTHQERMGANVNAW
jgi:chaperonin cofactor prefoldin